MRRPACTWNVREGAEVAELLGCEPAEVVFTSGGSEANNLALKGVFYARVDEIESQHIITTAVEHPAIVAPCEFLARQGRADHRPSGGRNRVHRPR